MTKPYSGKAIGLYYANKRKQKMAEKAERQITDSNIWAEYAATVGHARGNDTDIRRKLAQTYKTTIQHVDAVIHKNLSEMTDATYSKGEAILKKALNNLSEATEELQGELLAQIEELDKFEEEGKSGKAFIVIEETETVSDRGEEIKTRRIPIAQRKLELLKDYAKAATEIPRIMGQLADKNKISVFVGTETLQKMSNEELDKLIAEKEMLATPNQNKKT